MLAGGFRVSSGRPFVTSGGRTFGQSFSYALSLDRDSERVTKGAATDSSEGSLHHVRGSQGLSTSACCSASYESPAVPSRSSVGSFTKKSVRDSDMCDHSPTRPPSISRSPSASICRSREGRSGLLLSAPILLGFNLPSLDRSQRSGAAPSRSASLRPIKAMGGNPEEGKKALSSGPDFREAGDMLLNKVSIQLNRVKCAQACWLERTLVCLISTDFFKTYLLAVASLVRILHCNIARTSLSAPYEFLVGGKAVGSNLSSPISYRCFSHSAG